MPRLSAAIAAYAACAIRVLAIDIAVSADGQVELSKEDIDRQDYQDFRAKHRKDQTEDALSYGERFQLYRERKAFVDKHNARNGITWTAAVNVFADYSDAEFKALLGHRRLGKWWEASPMGSLQQASVVRREGQDLAASVDWRQNLVSTNYVKQQGACGSCWAVAAAGALEIHAEIAMKKEKKHSSQVPRNVSFKQLVDCTPNPEHCGGDGGCQGATSELAFEYASRHGLHDAKHYSGNINRGEDCKAASKKSPPYMQLHGYVRLETNKLKPLMEALANVGPVSVSVDAADWNMYGGGIFNDCKRDSIVNHAVLAVGYGHDPKSGLNYWLIRNSWGRDWGEQGFVRLQRHDGDDSDWDAGYCGFDTDPKQGTGCDGGPSTIPVCGMCGVLSDSSYPKQVTVKESD
mmetsp:Transcript_41966/g.100003  ORF Transcript_41966/g.100003 Transcript_41966/m.100003 type:complete len:405 (+) Transcript_41966:65-1279(+)|eukprot:CAMPEP_0181430494 /NCGR_PEP_ID=MMETSP1110-20121109/17750_1 /TAXON_ID=174948 /ORGANISM="Symbiodinium sp., Strain CCMP421" /LENGTH=404 /DNA_ID=CAMNT_0023553807 /DNA_START=37 /DNA_END=1251 /DNA_ORIENTATION=-